jgi:hypothetical protein
MNARLIQQLAEAGIRLSATGDKLQVEVRSGIITPELRDLLTHHKAALVSALSGETANADPHADRAISAALSMLQDDADRKAGRVPAGDTATMLCRSCGPVYIHPAIAAAMPTVAGVPRALGCPWCFIAKDGPMAIPRPPVTCGTCTNFIADKINPAGGVGRCRLGIQPKRPPLPFTQQHCGQWRPAATSATPQQTESQMRQKNENEHKSFAELLDEPSTPVEPVGPFSEALLKQKNNLTPGAKAIIAAGEEARGNKGGNA